MTLCYPSTTDWSCYGTEAAIDGLDKAIKRRSEILAWYSLAQLCAWQIGVCATQIRPCSAACAHGAGTWAAAPVGGGEASALPLRTIGTSFTPYVTGGNWVNGCGCASASSCSCSSLDSVVLPGPVGGIEWVKLDGVVLPENSYRVDGGIYLVNQGGTPWPAYQIPNPAPDEGLVVSYYRGSPPNELTNFAAGVLASEFYKACSGSKCRLPAGTTSVVRGGTSIEIETTLFRNGRTGIREVDAVINIYNPNGLKSPARVLSPDAPTSRRTTWRAY